MAEQELKVPLTEKIKSIPGFFGIHFTEKPKFKLLLEQEGIELREYEPMLIAKTTVHGSPAQAKEQAFKKLAGYIFGQNRAEKKMAMTAPVLQQEKPHASGDLTDTDYTMSFVLPSEIEAKSAPMPLDPEVHLEEVPLQTWAVIQYSGENNPEQISEHSAKLQQWLLARGHKLDLKTMRIAEYDAPSTISALKKNEIQIRLWSQAFH